MQQLQQDPRKNTPRLWQHHFPVLTSETHKYKRGHCLVWSGNALQTGASRLSATAALRIGAGLVTLIGEREALLVHAAHVTSVMLREVRSAEELDTLLNDTRMETLVIGPAAGVNVLTLSAIRTACQKQRKLVLDADALSVFRGHADQLAKIITENTQPIVVTPHEGEFQNLFPDLKGTREERACAAATFLGAIVVLKGAQTVIARQDGTYTVNDNATPYLATAGSGDVLSGIIGGLLTQGMSGFEAACAGVYVHGLAGNVGGMGLIAEDLPDFIPLALQRLMQEFKTATHFDGRI